MAGVVGVVIALLPVDFRRRERKGLATNEEGDKGTVLGWSFADGAEPVVAVVVVVLFGPTFVSTADLDKRCPFLARVFSGNTSESSLILTTTASFSALECCEMSSSSLSCVSWLFFVLARILLGALVCDDVTFVLFVPVGGCVVLVLVDAADWRRTTTFSSLGFAT